MANAIYTGVFSSGQTLPAAQMNDVIFYLNNHDHGTEANGGIPAQFIPQVLTTSQKTALVSPSLNLMVYDTTLAAWSYWNGSSWVNLVSGPLTLPTYSGSDPVSPVNGQIWLRTDF